MSEPAPSPKPAQPEPAPGLRLHHIGYAVPDIAAAAPLFTHALGYTPATPILHDPLQTALVQFFTLPLNPSFLELVAPDGPESKLTRTAQKRPGLHHLCYTAPTLPAAIAHLAARGMLLFADPQPAVAFAQRKICWLMAPDGLLLELVERRHEQDPCPPGL